MNEPGFELDALAKRVIGVAIELASQQIPFQRQAPAQLKYKNQPVGDARMDLLVDESLVVELKAVDSLAPIHHAQVINYLKATGYNLGLLINFNVVKLRDGVKRIVLT